ncbi:MAG TPA: tetratricopeptide repeat protein [Thermoanaerobaculia bacterium]
MARRKSSSRRKAAAVPEATAAPATPGRGATTTLQKLLLAAFGVALTVVLLLVAEGVLALLGAGERHRYEDPFVGFEPGRDLFLREGRPGGDVYVTSPDKLAYFNHQEFPAAKAPGTYRAFALGGSTTAGRPYDDRVAFARWMELYLAAMDPSRRFEVVNAGAISYASYRVVVLMRELVRYRPDLFVIYTGHNEFLEERSYSDLIHEDPRWRRLRLALDRLRTFTLAREGLRRLAQDGGEKPPATLLASEVETRLEGWTGLAAYRRDDELRRSIVEHFGFNLRQMVRIARDHGVEVVFVRPVSNLKDFSPFKSQPGAPDSENADAQFRRGRALFESGDYDAAKPAFVRAKDLDVAPLRALEPISALVAEVAAQSGAPLIDLPAILEQDCAARYGHRILGNEYLLDHVHPDVAVHSLIAERVIDVLVARGAVRPAASWSSDSWSRGRRREIYDGVVGALDRRYYAYRDLNLAKVLGWAGKLAEAEPPLVRAAAVLRDEPEVHLNLGVLYQKTDRHEAALGELERAVELEPGSALAHFNLGVTLGLLGRTEPAIAALELALRLKPDYAEARYDLGVLRRRQGDLEGALAALQEVLRERPGAAEVHREIGIVYRRQGRFDDAAAALRRALEIAPGDAVARTDLGITYGRQGREEEALAELRRAIELEPGYAEAHYNLGVVHGQAGRVDEALAAYRRALTADPAFADAHNNLGILLAGRGELEAARRELERAVELRPGHAEAHFNLGVVYDQSGLPAAALAAVERAIELEPGSERFRQARALLLAATGDG